MGGLGKTALAKMVFNHSKIVDHFEKKVWVCLGDLNEFNVNQVMVKIVKSLTSKESVNSDPEQLQSCLRDSLCNKRFLLVLDDVWVADRAKWLELKELLACGASGSRVMVTTRDSSVAKNMSSTLEHGLEDLGHDECVTLFKKFAFEEGEVDQNLMRIGDVIVGKCKGVPLAIKTLGCLLFSKKNISDWEFVRDNDIWQLEQKKDDILPALKISYNQLPFVLKQCFLYCSIFPKDVLYDNHMLIKHWSGYGLLRPSVKSIEVEDVGQQYIKELCVRGFFQDFQDLTYFSLFKMHDLFHDLALSVTQKELKDMTVDRQGKEICKSVRHVSFSKREGLGGKEVLKLFLTKNSNDSCVMPTIWSVIFDQFEGADDGAQLAKTCITELKNLRIMDLSDTPSLERLPSSIGALKHLTFLSLDRCPSLKRLPDSICQLYNLQTLSLVGCAELEELPKDVGDLVNLRNLGITTKQKRLRNGIESLSSLQDLRIYGCENLEYIFELGRNEAHQQLWLTSLKTLMIFDCNNLTGLVPSAPSMKKVSDMDILIIFGCPNINLDSIKDQIKLVKLKVLIFSNLPQIESLPQWISDEGCSTTLEYLFIGCQNLTSLPEWLNILTSLRTLMIYSCPKFLCMPKGLSALKYLEIEGCPELSRRCKRATGEDWPKIKHIPKIMLDRERQ